MALTELISGLQDDSGGGDSFSRLRWFSVIPFIVMGTMLFFIIRKKFKKNG